MTTRLPAPSARKPVREASGSPKAAPATARPARGSAVRELEFAKLDASTQIQVIRDGMDPAIVGRMATDLLGIPVQTLFTSIRWAPSTINRKIATGERLSPGESDRVARILIVHSQAADVLEDAKLASQWMLHPNALLGGERPLDMLDTQAGYDRVRDILMRFEYGVGV